MFHACPARAAERAESWPQRTQREADARLRNDVRITQEQIDSIQPRQWRDISDALKIELPKALTATVRDVRARVIELKPRLLAARPTSKC